MAFLPGDPFNQTNAFSSRSRPELGDSFSRSSFFSEKVPQTLIGFQLSPRDPQNSKLSVIRSSVQNLSRAPKTSEPVLSSLYPLLEKDLCLPRPSRCLFGESPDAPSPPSGLVKVLSLPPDDASASQIRFSPLFSGPFFPSRVLLYCALLPPPPKLLP